MAKEQERAELHRTIWQIAKRPAGQCRWLGLQKLRLGRILFYRFISENITALIIAEELGVRKRRLDMSRCSDEQAELGAR